MLRGDNKRKTAARAVIGVGAICAALAIAQPANANIVLDGGQPDITKKQFGNDLILPLYGQSPIDGFYFGDRSPKLQPGTVFYQGTLKVDVKSTIDFAYLGSEAGYKNQFQIDDGTGWQTLKTTPSAYGKNADVAGVVGPISGFANGPLAVPPPQIGSTYTFEAGEVIPFRFLINGGNGATRTAPNAGEKADFCKFCSILVTFLDDQNKPLDKAGQAVRSGSTVDLFVNDGNVDDNHDDMAIRITAKAVMTPVPLPAALPIAIAAFAGFGLAGWRHRRPQA